MNKKRIIDYIDSLEQQAKEANKFFKERNELYIENTNYKQALNDIRECINHWKVYECDKNTVRELSFESNKEDILEIIDKVLGDDTDGNN